MFIFAAYRWLRFSVAVFAGIFLIATGLPSIADTFGFLGHSAVARARIVDSQPNTDPKGNVSYCPVLAYTTSAGRSEQATGDQVCQDSPFQAGQAMMVRYDIARPGTMRVDNLLGIWGKTVWSVGAGIFVEIIAVLALLWCFRAPIRAWRQRRTLA